jgi:hypothetical protein
VFSIVAHKEESKMLRNFTLGMTTLILCATMADARASWLDLVQPTSKTFAACLDIGEMKIVRRYGVLSVQAKCLAVECDDGSEGESPGTGSDAQPFCPDLVFSIESERDNNLVGSEFNDQVPKSAGEIASFDDGPSPTGDSVCANEIDDFVAMSERGDVVQVGGETTLSCLNVRRCDCFITGVVTTYRVRQHN